MTFLQDVPVGAIIYLECGCWGHRLTPREEQSIVVTVEKPCPTHEPKGQHVRYLPRNLLRGILARCGRVR
jgi:hypothetical protein